jgi:indole-3-glycerol phosphate synthase
MSNFLDEIIELKKKRLEFAKSKITLEELKEKAIIVRRNSESHRLQKSLGEKDEISIIAEIKRASPSKGVINDGINVAEIARMYERGGACAISVLTEEDKFKGSLDDLKTVRANVSLPILRKDFIFDEFQIYEAAEAGADVILLIAAMLDDEILLRLLRLAEQELKLDVLLEVHTLEELERAKKIGARIIGVNNRDLHSFKVSLDVSRQLVQYAKKDSFLISESGLQTREDLLELEERGFKGFLIGETLMRSKNVEEELRQLVANKNEQTQNNF